MYYRAGRVSSCGSRLRAERLQSKTATALERLDEAGAIETGRLVMVEFALGPHGYNANYPLCRNMWNPDHIPCGSSERVGRRGEFWDHFRVARLRYWRIHSMSRCCLRRCWNRAHLRPSRQPGSCPCRSRSMSSDRSPGECAIARAFFRSSPDAIAPTRHRSMRRFLITKQVSTLPVLCPG